MYVYGGYQDLKGSTSELWAFHFGEFTKGISSSSLFWHINERESWTFYSLAHALDCFSHTEGI